LSCSIIHRRPKQKAIKKELPSEIDNPKRKKKLFGAPKVGKTTAKIQGKLSQFPFARLWRMQIPRLSMPRFQLFID
jgi:hypothetical protein